MNALRDTVETGELKQYIVIKYGEEKYGIPIKYIDNIVKMQQVTRVPKSEAFIKGVINIRGDIVPVLSMRIRMGMEDDVYDDDTCILVLRPDNSSLFGIIVDAVDRVLTLGSNSIEKVSQESGRKDSGFVLGVGKYDEGLVSIFDLDSLLLERNDDKKKPE